MRRLRSALAGFALSAGTALAAGSPPLAESLLASLAQAPPVSTPFVQVSYRGVLDRPLVVSGTLRWRGGDRFEREVTAPFAATATIDGGELSMQRADGRIERLPLAQAPQVAAMLAGFRALLGGDAAGLRRDFTLSAQGAPKRWVVTLTPRAAALQRQLASIVIDGRERTARCFTVNDPDGDVSITLLGALAVRGPGSVAPQQSAVAALCRNP